MYMCVYMCVYVCVQYMCVCVCVCVGRGLVGRAWPPQVRPVTHVEDYLSDRRGGGETEYSTNTWCTQESGHISCATRYKQQIFK